MERLNSDRLNYSKIFLVTGLLLLLAGMLFGLIGALQYLIPGLLKLDLSFEKIRPLHVTSVIFWIIMGAAGSVLTYLQEHTGKKINSNGLVMFQYFVFLSSVLLMLASYCFGIFGGREYWEFHPLLALPVIAGWIMFLINFVKSAGSLKGQPVYMWMWLTGVFFFLFTYIESYLWLIPYFGKHVINDMTIQWKSYGSMVGSWNMLIYGSSIFLMEKISGNKTYSRSVTAFILYFTGLFNLMFNWGHHIYTLPTYPYIQYISYAVSMTELFIFGRIIFLWRSTVSEARKHSHQVAYRFLMAADTWIFLTLFLAILMSVPAINVYTHGTHVTVAHTMGATIGINSLLLLAFVFDILGYPGLSKMHLMKWVDRGNRIINLSLFVFWICLICAGMIKAKWQMSESPVPFSSMMINLRPFFIVFFLSGITMFSGFMMVVYPLLKNHFFGLLKKAAGIRELKEDELTTVHLKN